MTLIEQFESDYARVVELLPVEFREDTARLATVKVIMRGMFYMGALAGAKACTTPGGMLCVAYELMGPEWAAGRREQA